MSIREYLGVKLRKNEMLKNILTKLNLCDIMSFVGIRAENDERDSDGYNKYIRRIDQNEHIYG